MTDRRAIGSPLLVEAGMRTRPGGPQAPQSRWICAAAQHAAEAIRARSSADEALVAAARLVPMLAGASSSVLVCSTAQGDFRIRSTYGLSEADREALEHRLRAQLGDQACLRSADLVTELALHAVADQSAAAHRGAWTALPICDGGSLSGVLLARLPPAIPPPQRNKGGQFDGGAILTRVIVDHASAALEAHRLRLRRQEEEYVSAALLQTARAVAGVGSLPDVLSTVARLPTALAGADQCLVFRWDSQTVRFACMASHGVSRDGRRRLADCSLSPDAVPLLWELRLLHREEQEAGRAGERQLRRASISESGLLRGLLELGPESDRAVLGFPLLANGGFVGALVLTERSLPRARAGRTAIFQGIADQAAIAIENDRLRIEAARRAQLEQEMRTAREIQMSLMAGDMPPAPGWDIAAACVPAREVGGDFYDVFRVSESSVGILVGDVADKGMPAALFMATARAMIRVVASREGSPATVLNEVNRLLTADSYRAMFVTVFYGLLDTIGGVLTYCNAGHNPPLLRRYADGRVVPLAPTGRALAILEDAALTEEAAELDAGDWLVLYTDGVTEAESPELHGQFGRRRLEALLERKAWDRAEGLVQAVVEAVYEFAGSGPQSDDRTLLVLGHRATVVPADAGPRPSRDSSRSRLVGGAVPA